MPTTTFSYRVEHRIPNRKGWWHSSHHDVVKGAGKNSLAKLSKIIEERKREFHHVRLVEIETKILISKINNKGFIVGK